MSDQSKWQNDYLTGIVWQDAQHKLFLDKFNALALIYAYEGDPDIEKLIFFLELYADNHFTTEEAYMELTDYPDIINHRIEHENFLNSIKEIDRNITKLDGEVFCEKMKSWFVNHIRGVDHEFGEYLRSKGQF
ncbi:MAG: hypothetical protein HOD92_26850 [Deltaproteobacteria bacterium]|jgi:hemerythrin|nr:hypothetical protein [Deltaproteobacteria bacterium]